ncbi:hypothetical protein LMG7974_01453 [Campylobacter majalis]|uniref:Prepilin-type N-terminal cleavage/methylation domain-containing protein n=1 Tax=Campylobacter majalis TaxID=2790656 RepID=A0ABN7KA82_9BACT|nr:type II secretion system protein [Campylobacter majalis]CAD7289302.1 hypothetical protein LMG7974_01453 [Campylobacter majalis]
MKSAFTLIEIIFVVTIISILAVVSIPKFMLGTNDADILKASKNLSTIISDVGMYYVANAKLADDIRTMTNVYLDDAGDKNSGYIVSAGKKCIKVIVKDENVFTRKPAHIKIEEGPSPDKSTKRCLDIMANKNVQNLRSLSFKYKIESLGRSTTHAIIEVESDVGEIALGYSAVE